MVVCVEEVDDGVDVEDVVRVVQDLVDVGHAAMEQRLPA